MAVPDSNTPVRSKMAIDRLIARRDIHLREKTLWRMLYETCAHSDEVLDVNTEDLDLAGRRCPVKAKGAQPKVRRRGTARSDYGWRRCSGTPAPPGCCPACSRAVAAVRCGWGLHEYRHSSLPHLGEQSASELMLMAKSRHKKADSVRRYFKPSTEAIASVTGLPAPGDARR
jgi:integrase/recombinase XerC